MSDTFYKVKVYFSQYEDDQVEWTGEKEPQIHDGQLIIPIGKHSQMTYAAGAWHHVYVVDESPAWPWKSAGHGDG